MTSRRPRQVRDADGIVRSADVQGPAGYGDVAAAQCVVRAGDQGAGVDAGRTAVAVRGTGQDQGTGADLGQSARAGDRAAEGGVQAAEGDL